MTVSATVAELKMFTFKGALGEGEWGQHLFNIKDNKKICKG